MDGVDDWSADADGAGGFVDGERVRDSFGDHAEGSDGFFEAFALAEGEADAVVSRVDRKTGGNQVADAGKTGKGFDAATESDAESGHFRKGAGDEG